MFIHFGEIHKEIRPLYWEFVHRKAPEEQQSFRGRKISAADHSFMIHAVGHSGRKHFGDPECVPAA